jgi:glycine/D-amino acid oxidase-like deaminating enzyme
MRTRYGVSPWIHDFPSTRRPDYPRLRGEHAATVVIVGAGLTGCATAYACAMAGLKPIVIDAGRVGQGSAGRSAGLLLPEPGPAFRDVAQAHGLRAARRVFETWAKGAVDAATLLRRLRIPGGAVEEFNNLIVAARGDEKALQREQAALADAGLEARALTQKQVRQATALDAGVGIRLREAFAVDPYRACVGLATAAARRGAVFFERSAVKNVRSSTKRIEMLLDGGTVTAETAVITTGVATAEFKPLRRHFKARETYLVLTDEIPAAVRKQLGRRDATLRDTRVPRHRLRWTADDRIVIAGGDQDATPARTRNAVLVQRTGQLMYELLMMYPGISGLQPAFGWDLPYGDTADGLMYIGPHRNYPRHLFALGTSGDSITGAFVAARLLTRALRGESEKGDDVFGWAR